PAPSAPRVVDEVAGPPGHDTIASLTTKAPGSFKRMLGRALAHNRASPKTATNPKRPSAIANSVQKRTTVSRDTIPARANVRYATTIAAAGSAEPSRAMLYPGTPSTRVSISMLSGNPSSPTQSVTSARV